MGGAVASLLAVLLVDEARWAAPVRVYTFGAPAVGGPDVAQLACLERSHRFVRPGDVAPRRVPVSGYEQHGFDVLIESGRFSCLHSRSARGRARLASEGGVLKTAQLVRALGVEPHNIAGYFREIDNICVLMQRAALELQHKPMALAKL